MVYTFPFGIGMDSKSTFFLIEKLKTVLPLLLTISLLSPKEISGLQCYECTNMEGSPNFKKDCDSNPRPLKDGFAGCLEIWGLVDHGKTLVIRAGHWNKQTEGRVPSCYHPEQTFIVDAAVENFKMDTITYCYACDHADGCNSVPPNKTSISYTFYTVILFLHFTVYYFLPVI